MSCRSDGLQCHGRRTTKRLSTRQSLLVAIDGMLVRHGWRLTDSFLYKRTLNRPFPHQADIGHDIPSGEVRLGGAMRRLRLSLEDLPRRHRITVHEQHRMGEVGLLAPHARVEPIEDEILDMAPIGGGHRSTVMRLDRLLQRAVADAALILCRSSIRLGPVSEP